MAQDSATFSQHAAQLRRQIDAALSACAVFSEGCPIPLGEAIRYSLLAPGKRLRPMLTLLASEACGTSISAAMPAACAVEMIHAYSLVHDDLPAMDDDDLRRGRATTHKKFGEALAILVGDALLALAFEVAARDIRPAAVAARCCAALAEAAGATALVGGQADDLSAEALAADMSAGQRLSALESTHRRKTGALIRVSLRLGGLVAQADASQLASLDEYGRDLGLAFQIVDDLLDVRGEEVALGKRVGKDTDRGKLTFPALLGVEESARRAEQLVNEACAALAPLGSQAGALESLARYALERNH